MALQTDCISEHNAAYILYELDQYVHWTFYCCNLRWSHTMHGQVLHHWKSSL